LAQWNCDEFLPLVTNFKLSLSLSSSSRGENMKKLWVVGVVILGTFFSPTASAAKKCDGVDQSMCIQVYAPAWCVALSVGGEVVKSPVLGKGSNACFALGKLRKRACEQGLNWKELSDEEVHCVVLPQ
jgi:hypothetical protein